MPGHLLNLTEMMPAPTSVHVPGLVAFIFGGPGGAEVVPIPVPAVAGAF